MFKSSKGKDDIGKRTEVSSSSQLGQGIGGGGASGPVTPAASASGGNVNGLEPGNGYTYQTFTSPGTLTVTGASIRADIFVLGGGGGGGAGNGSGGTGGGAGGLAYIGSRVLEIDDYPVTIGNGGGGAGNGPRGGTGGDTTFGPGTPTPITAKGGGGGGGSSGSPSAPGAGGGCGGGGSDTGYFGGSTNQPPQNGPLQPEGLFNFGQPGMGGQAQPGDTFSRGGAGGGLGGQGYTTNNFPSQFGPPAPETFRLIGKGGNSLPFNGFDGTTIGVPSLSPFSGQFGGGGGCYYNGPGPDSNNGFGGGAGAGSSPGGDATDNTGSGGAGGPESGSGGDGGNGICIIRWKINYEPLS